MDAGVEQRRHGMFHYSSGLFSNLYACMKYFIMLVLASRIVGSAAAASEDKTHRSSNEQTRCSCSSSSSSSSKHIAMTISYLKHIRQGFHFHRVILQIVSQRQQFKKWVRYYIYEEAVLSAGGEVMCWKAYSTHNNINTTITPINNKSLHYCHFIHSNNIIHVFVRTTCGCLCCS